MTHSYWLFHYAAILLLGLLPAARAAASIDTQVSAILDEYEGIGLTGWSVNGEGNLCSLGSAGRRFKDSHEVFVTTGDSRHQINSVTKSITSSVLAIPIEDGTISGGWNTPLYELLSASEGTAYENVTLGQLVSHVSGIARDAPSSVDGVMHVADEHVVLRKFRKTLAEAALASTPVNNPGTTFLYSNWGYVVAGHIIEALANAAWEDVVANRLFRPLGIHLGENVDEFTGVPNNDKDPWGHSSLDQSPCDPFLVSDNPFEEGLSHCYFNRAYVPASGFSGPVAAMARYFAWHIQCHNGEIPANDPSASLLSQESCQQIHQPFDKSINDHYGYGWVCRTVDWDGGLICTHDGSNDLNLYEVWLSFDMDRAFVAYTNGVQRERRYGRYTPEELIMLKERHTPEQLMLDATINATIMGDQECDSRIPSSVYIDAKDASASRALIVGYGGWIIGVLFSAMFHLGIL